MNINAKKLIGLNVRTQSGEHLGKIYDFEVDSDRGEIIKFYVGNFLIANKILNNNLIVDKSQVLEISAEEMVVEDNIEKIRSVKAVGA